MKLVKILAAVAVLCAAVAAGGFFWWKKTCESFLAETRVSGEYFIERGAGYAEVYDTLFAGQQAPPFFGVYLARVMKVDRKLHYGYYSAKDIPVGELLHNVITGKQTLVRVTFPEGYNIYDVATTIAGAEIASREAMLGALTDRKLVAKLTGNSYESLEGFLAPGTYFFEKKHSPEGIADKMTAEFYRLLPEDFEAKAARQGLSFYDAVTLASIVQKETYSEYEAPIVAAVFLNRIKKKMLIQADPTIIYGIYETFDGRLRTKDLRDSVNRYNTYTHRGLPPTPISNPSAVALKAVIEPAKVDYLYFVATREGKHIFAQTYEEHRKNVRIHQLGASN